MTRAFPSFCWLLLVWFCALGTEPARQSAAQPLVARSAVELALRDVAEAPMLAPRAAAARIVAVRLADRDAPPTHVPTPAARVERAPAAVAREARTTLALQDFAHRDRPRWRAYDAAAPPAPSSSAR